MLFHNPAGLATKTRSLELYENLKRLKKNGIVKKIGISIYEFSMFEKINRNFRTDTIQNANQTYLIEGLI